MAEHFVRDPAAVGRILKGQPIAGLVQQAATAVAADARTRTGHPITTTTGMTDRATASVIIAHPAGAAAQANDGVLTRAAEATGLTVRPR